MEGGKAGGQGDDEGSGGMREALGEGCLSIQQALLLSPSHSGQYTHLHLPRVALALQPLVRAIARAQLCALALPPSTTTPIPPLI